MKAGRTDFQTDTEKQMTNYTSDMTSHLHHKQPYYRLWYALQSENNLNKIGKLGKLH